jgi:hypothetical protein
MSRAAFPLVLFAGVAAAAPKEISTDLANHAPLAAAIADADKVTVFEGLPHQSSEKDSLERELKAKKTVTLHDFPFYAETLAVADADTKSLTALAADGKSVQKWAGAKPCGGFHPDYALEWTVGKDTYRMLVCFGCHEVKLYGPKAAVYADMSDHGLHGLEKILKPLRKNRPKRGK